MDIPPSGIRITTQEELDKVLTERPGQNIHIDQYPTRKDCRHAETE